MNRYISIRAKCFPDLIENSEICE